jgi:hypothetical protein
VDAKGDLVAASAADTPARLAVGSNGESLVADSSTSTGLRYQAPVQQNPVINSAFQVWQRSTSAALGSAGVVTSADRWATYTGGNGTMSRQVTGDTTNLPNIQYCARIQRNSGETSTSQLQVGQSFETINSIPFAGKTVTLSFYARAGANYSPTSGAFLAFLKSGTGTDQNLVSTGYTGSVTTASTTATLTTTWQRFSVSGTVATTATELGLEFRFTPVGTAGVNDYAEVTGVQLEVGSVATPFHTYAATIQGELSACQRYYWRNSATQVYAAFFSGTGVNSTSVQGALQLPVTMRVSPASVDYSTLGIGDNSAGATFTSLALVTSQSSTQQAWITVTGSGFTQYRTFFIYSGNSTSGYIGVSAEL